jgi:hypothetical protein
MRTDTNLLLNWKSWPCYPCCPVKQRQENGYGMPKMGVVIAPEMQNRSEGTSPDPFHVYHINLYALKSGPLMEQLEGVEKDTYHSIEDMSAAGWVVD